MGWTSEMSLTLTIKKHFHLVLSHASSLRIICTSVNSECLWYCTVLRPSRGAHLLDHEMSSAKKGRSNMFRVPENWCKGPRLYRKILVVSQTAIWKSICFPLLSPNNLRRVSWKPLHRNKPWQIIDLGWILMMLSTRLRQASHYFSCKRTHFACLCALRTLEIDALEEPISQETQKNSNACWSSLVWAIGSVFSHCFRNRPESRWHFLAWQSCCLIP